MAHGISLIGRSCDVIIRAGGSLVLEGRLILSGYNQLYAAGNLKIGDRVSINEYSRVVAFESISIGNNVTIAKFVTIVDHDHTFLTSGEGLIMDGYSTDPIVIGDNVLIGDKVTILKGVSIGMNVVIASNAVVAGDVPDNSLIGGVPARVLRKL